MPQSLFSSKQKKVESHNIAFKIKKKNDWLSQRRVIPLPDVTSYKVTLREREWERETEKYSNREGKRKSVFSCSNVCGCKGGRERERERERERQQKSFSSHLWWSTKVEFFLNLNQQKQEVQ